MSEPSIHCSKVQNSRIRYRFFMLYDPSSSLIGSSTIANWVPGFVMEIFRNNLGALFSTIQITVQSLFNHFQSLFGTIQSLFTLLSPLIFVSRDADKH